MGGGNVRYKKREVGLGQVVQCTRESSCTLKGYGFDPQSGHLPRLWVQSQAGVYTRGDNLRIKVSLKQMSLSLPVYLYLCLCLFPPPSLLSSLPLFLKSINISLSEDLKKGRSETYKDILRTGQFVCSCMFVGSK